VKGKCPAWQNILSFLCNLIAHLNPTIMFKLFLPLAIFVIVACNNSKNSPAAGDVKGSDTTTAKSFTWNSEDEKEFLAQCVESAKGNINDTTAYAHCKCVLEQLKQVYPNMDSVAAVMDTAMAKKYAANCK
jgi:hypothetical protein